MSATRGTGIVSVSVAEVCAFDQLACQNSHAQEELNALALSVCEYFEDRVEYQVDPDPDRSTWTVAEYRPPTAGGCPGSR